MSIKRYRRGRRRRRSTYPKKRKQIYLDKYISSLTLSFLVSHTLISFLTFASMNWILLIIAGLFEVGFATCLGKAKEHTGTAATLWMLGFFACLTVSMVLLYKVTQTLPIGTAYAGHRPAQDGSWARH